MGGLSYKCVQFSASDDRARFISDTKENSPIGNFNEINIFLLQTSSHRQLDRKTADGVDAAP